MCTGLPADLSIFQISVRVSLSASVCQYVWLCVCLCECVSSQSSSMFVYLCVGHRWPGGEASASLATDTGIEPHWVGLSNTPLCDRLVGLVLRRPPRERKIPGSNPACAGIFSGSSHTSDFKIGTPVATLPGAWRYRVSTGTGRPGVSIL